MAPQQTDTENVYALPPCFEGITLDKAIRQQVGDFKRILEIKTDNVNGENADYSSIMTRITAKVELEGKSRELKVEYHWFMFKFSPIDGTSKVAAFILKAQQGNEIMAKILNILRIYQKEEEIYQKILPKFEKLYKDAGKDIQFAPKSYTFDRDTGVDYVLLEDLCTKKYKNANRIDGLDMQHLQKVLIKLAEFHAASACYVEHYGMFSEDFTVGIYNGKHKALLKEFNASDAFLKQLKKWKNCELYYEKLVRQIWSNLCDTFYIPH